MLQIGSCQNKKNNKRSTQTPSHHSKKMKECITLRDLLKKGDSRTGKVEQGNIDGILKDSMKAYNNWIKNPKNKGKEFRYEIDKDTPDK